ncbi:MAG TPA: helix-turn-helix domain-containing protein [Herpetosiphonaceae bacterium]
MNQRGNVYDAMCPTRLVLDRIADKWNMLIVDHLALGTVRFGALQRAICGVSPKVLTHSLRELERDGIVARRVYASVPPKVEYSLTPLGQTLIPLVAAIRDWAEGNIGQVLAAHQTFDQRQQAEAEPAPAF